MDLKAFLVVVLTLNTGSFASAHLQPSRALERTQCKFQDQTDVTVEYGSINMKGRKVFGHLVPYGQVWATGDGRTSTFVTSANLIVGGKEVPAGTYILSTIPDPERWTMLLKKGSSKESLARLDEVAKVDLTVRHLLSPRESFTISFDQVRGGCVMNLRWEQTEASVLLAEKK